MRAVVQRVEKAEVRVEEKVVGKIGKGLFVLLGVKKGDTNESAIKLADKISKLRVMSDGKNKMNLSVMDVGAEILVVSQFTLIAETKGQNRPSFINAADAELGCELYDLFIKRLNELGINPQKGKFGLYMNIDVKLDGPVTIIIDL